MKKKLLYFLVPISAIVIIVSILLITAFVPNNNSKLYESELTGMDIIVPQAAFGFSEAVDDETYTVRFFVWSTEANVIEMLYFVEQETSNNRCGYVLDEWSVNNQGLYNEVYISYTIEKKSHAEMC